MTVWNPEQYLKFERERAQPALDLTSHIPCARPGRVLDLGCGPGNSTAPLWDRWPTACVEGIDHSPQMISAAQHQYPDRRWRVGQATQLPEGETWDVIAASAVIQWIPDHQKLLSHLLSRLNPGGSLAVQVPQYHRMPVSQVVDETFRSLAGATRAEQAWAPFHFEQAPFYDDILSPLVKRLTLWETSYFHVMPSHESILEMVRSTGLRPYLGMLSEQDQEQEFLAEVLKGLKAAYPTRSGGGVIFPFLRLFFVAEL